MKRGITSNSMKLKKLIKDFSSIQVKGLKDIEITGIGSDSKRIAPGNLFVAKRGIKHHGSTFIPDAIASGAVAVLTDIFDPFLKDVVQLIHHDPREIEGALASRFYEDPSCQMLTIGLTGTNGKTTTSYLIKHILDQAKKETGLIGTIEYIIGNTSYPPTHTTPDVTTNQKLLHEMVVKGCQCAVMEATSHALDQRRVANIDFDIAVFTNLTSEHLDYHKTMENYCEAKSHLFTELKPSGLAVINADDPWHSRISAKCSAPVLTFGIDSEADFAAKEVMLTPTGTAFTLVTKQGSYDCITPLVGRFNVYNTLAAIGALHQQLPIKTILHSLKTFSAVPGRLQLVPNPLNYKIIVDFAHTDAALENVLSCLSEFKKGKVITVFGCGGDRDRSKRPLMAKVAEKYSDAVIVTSDNPRSEDPLEICKEVSTGFTKEQWIEVDRYQAIKKAVSMATSEDLILIAGKGHEAEQIFAHTTKEFDDAKVAFDICQQQKESLACV